MTKSLYLSKLAEALSLTYSPVHKRLIHQLNSSVLQLRPVGF